MKKLLLAGVAVLLGLALFIDNSFFRSSVRRIASDSGLSTSSGTGENEMDLSALNDEDFARAFKYRLITPMQLQRTNPEGSQASPYPGEQQSIRLGNFYIKGSDNQKIFACSKFNFMELSFQAEGIAVSGEIPRMTVHGPCVSSNDFNFIQTAPIPYEAILASPISQTQFRIPLVDSGDSALISFHYTAEQWPRDWNLIGIKLYSDYSGEILSLTGYEIISIRGEPFVLRW